MNDQTVFVVHGRNLALRDAMYQLLRSLKLSPLEWEQARQLTNRASPATLDVIKAGMEAAACTIVLMTGDDQARLHPRFANEPLEAQPRPNVLFEAGWALASFGSERTILVTVGLPNLRGFSDLHGLNRLDLTNSPDRRKSLVDRLKTAQMRVDDSGNDFLTPERGGDFEPKTSTAPDADGSEQHGIAVSSKTVREFVKPMALMALGTLLAIALLPVAVFFTTEEFRSPEPNLVRLLWSALPSDPAHPLTIAIGLGLLAFASALAFRQGSNPPQGHVQSFRATQLAAAFLVLTLVAGALGTSLIDPGTEKYELYAYNFVGGAEALDLLGFSSRLALQLGATYLGLLFGLRVRVFGDAG